MVFKLNSTRQKVQFSTKVKICKSVRSSNLKQVISSGSFDKHNKFLMLFLISYNCEQVESF